MNTKGMNELTQKEALELFAAKKLVWIVSPDTKQAWVARSMKDIILSQGKLMAA